MNRRPLCMMLIALVLMVLVGAAIAGAGKSPRRTLKIKLVADEEFARQFEWERKAKRLLTDIAEELAGLLYVDFELVGYEIWPHEPENDLYRLTAQMIDAVNPGDADVTIGFTLVPCLDNVGPGYADAVTIPFRGMLIRTYYARCPRNAYIPYVMIHEMVHLFGGLHTNFGSLMSPMFTDTIALDLDPLNQRIVRLTRDMDFARGYASLSRRTLENLTAIYRQIIAAGNNEPVTLSQLSAMYLTLGEIEKARPIAENIISGDSTFTHVWLQLAECHRRSGSVETAISLLETAVDYADNKGPVYSLLARLYVDLGDYDTSRRYAELAEKHGSVIDSALWEQVRQNMKIGDK